MSRSRLSKYMNIDGLVVGCVFTRQKRRGGEVPAGIATELRALQEHTFFFFTEAGPARKMYLPPCLMNCPSASMSTKEPQTSIVVLQGGVLML